MAESNATQVILTDDGIKIIKAQNTADNATGGVADLNDPNLMSVIEKQTAVSQYAGLTSQYNVILARAKDDNISTTDLTTAYTNLNTFMATILTDTTKASDVDRDTYKVLTDAYNTQLSKVQTALSNSFNNDIDNMQSSVSVASQAASSAVIVASQAAITGDNANQVASRAIGVANQAKSAGDNAVSVANNASQAASSAILAGSTAAVNADKAVGVANQAKSAGDNATSVANNASQAASSAIIAGSTAAVNANKALTAASQAQDTGNNATSVANSASQAASNAILVGSTAAVSASQASADYQTLSAGVKDGSVVHITTETVIDKGVIGTAEIANAAITNAQIGNEAVNSSKIADLAVGTAQIGDGAITNAKIGSLAVGTAQIADAAITDAKIGSLAVGTAQIKDAAINSAKIAELAVGTAQIGDGAITNAKIGKLAVGTAQIADGAITNVQIGNEAVGTAQIADLAVNSAKIAELAVGTAQIGDGAITNAKIGKLAVGTAQIANGAITDAQIGSLAVGTAQIKDGAINSAKIASLAVGTAQIGDGAITTAKIGSLAVGTAQIANAAITDAQVGNVSANKLTAGTIDFNTITGTNINASNITTGILNTDRLNVNKLSALSADLGDVTTGSLKGVNIVAKTFSTPNGSFTTYENGSVVASNLTIRGVTNLVYNAALLGGSGSSIPGWGISNNGACWVGNTHDGVPSIGFNASTGSGVWAMFAQTKLHPLNGDVYQPFSASVWFKEYGSDTNLQYQFTLAFFDSNGNRVEGYGWNTWNGIGSGQDWRYITINNILPPSNAVSVGLEYWSYNGHGNACFSSPMLTQTAQATGYQPDTGNVVNAGIVNGSTINASTINGSTFNAGSQLNSYGNTGYPLTIYPDGSLSSTTFRTISAGTDAQRASLKDGIFKTNLRGMTSFDNGKYLAADAILQSGQLALYQGYSDSQDANFTNTSLHATGYVIVDSTNGITLHGDDQWIRFNGYANDSNPQGIVMTPWGNINPQGNQSDWYVGNKNTDKTAQFGIDADHKVTINFYRPTFVDEIGAMGNRLTNGRLLLHDVAGTAQLYLLHDDAPAVVSPTIYNRTYSSGSNMYVTSSGRVGRSTSASKYKLAIARSDDTSQADRLMTLKPASWNDKVATEKMAKSLSNGEIPVEPEINLKRHYGLIAEDLRDAGLDEFLITGDNGQIEGIEYDRLWTVLIPKIKQLNNRINELERKTL
nr:hypothetical protein [Lactiplantibacillus plantarum]